jgi:hypothetical protein
MVASRWGSIRKLPSGAYQARYWFEGKQIGKTFSTLFLAQKFLEAKARELGVNWSMYKVARGKRIRSYGISEDEFDQMMINQEGKCYICKGDNGSIALCIDHDHLTGKVRGLLCNKCNRGLGLFSDDLVLLKRAMNYLIDGVVIKQETITYQPLKLVK